MKFKRCVSLLLTAVMVLTLPIYAGALKSVDIVLDASFTGAKLFVNNVAVTKSGTVPVTSEAKITATEVPANKAVCYSLGTSTEVSILPSEGVVFDTFMSVMEKITFYVKDANLALYTINYDATFTNADPKTPIDVKNGTVSIADKGTVKAEKPLELTVVNKPVLPTRKDIMVKIGNAEPFVAKYDIIKLPPLRLIDEAVVTLSLVDSVRPSDDPFDYGTEVLQKPIYQIRHYKKDVTTGADNQIEANLVGSTKASDITIWTNGGTKKLTGRDKNEYKVEQLVPTVLKNTKITKPDPYDKKKTVEELLTADRNYTKDNMKYALKSEGKKFKWYVTPTTVTAPMSAYLSKPNQTLGKLIASVSTSGKLTASSKAYMPTTGRLWVFDEDGDYGMVDFAVEVAPSAIYSLNVPSLAPTDVDKNGKPNNKSQVATSLEVGVNESTEIYLHSTFISGKNVTALSDERHGLGYYTYETDITADNKNYIDVLPITEAGNPNMTLGYTITGKKLKDNKLTSIKFNIVCLQSQKKVSVTVKVGNAVAGITIPEILPITTSKATAAVREVVADFLFKSADVKAMTDKPQLYIVKKDFIVNSLFNPTTGKFVTPSSSVKASGWKATGVYADVPNSNKGTYTVKITAPKIIAVADDLQLLIISNIEQTNGSYDGIALAPFKTMPVPTATIPDISVGGITNEVLTATDLKVTLTNTTFTSTVAVNNDVTAWLNLPLGLTASISKLENAAGVNAPIGALPDVATITIVGTPTEINSKIVVLTIPKEATTAAVPLVANSNTKAVYAITLSAAKVSNVIVEGLRNQPVADGLCTVTLYGDTLKSEIAIGADLSSLFAYLPAGLTATAQQLSPVNTKVISIRISGTPTVPFTAAFSMVIPATMTTSGKAVDVIMNANARFNIASAKGTVVATTVSGKKGTAITAASVVLKLEQTSIKSDLVAGADVASWITILPKGLTAKLSTAVKAGATEILVTIAGTPTEIKDVPIMVRIPGTNLTDGNDLYFLTNAQARFNITL